MVIDDQPLLSADRGDIRWNLVPLETLDRVEVVKGPSSVLYGSAALNGVIHARTAWPTAEPQTKVVAWTGTYLNPRNNATLDSLDIGINAEGDTLYVYEGYDSLTWWGNSRPVFSGIYASHMQQFGAKKNIDFVIGMAAIGNKGHLQDQLQDYVRGNIKLRYRPVEELSFGVSANFNAVQEGLFILWEDSAKLSSLPGATDYNQYVQSYIDPFITYFDPIGNQHKLRARYYRIRSHYDDLDRFKGTASIFSTEYQFYRPIGNWSDVTFGAQYTTFNVEDNSLANATGSIVAPYLQAEFHPLKRLTLSGGLRWEAFNIDDVTGASLPVFKGGINYQAARRTYLRASFGQGFRFPSLAERYVEYNIGAINYLPNEDLEPEQGWNAELGVKQQINVSDWKAYLDASVFVTEYKNVTEAVFDFHLPDTITFDNPLDSLLALEELLGNYLGWQFQNVGEARIAGIEYSAAADGKLFGNPLRIHAGYTYALPIDLQADSSLRDWGNFYRRFVNSFNADDTVTTSSILKYRFRNLAKFDVEYSINKLKVGFTGNYYSFMDRIDDIFVAESDWSPLIELQTGNAQAVPGVIEYRDANNSGNWIFGARVGFHPTENSSITLLGKNIFNRSYTVRPAKVEAPANYTLQYKITF